MTEDEAEILRLTAEMAALLAEVRRLERKRYPMPPPAPGPTINGSRPGE